MQLELVQYFRPRLPPKAVELLTMHTNDVAQITVPPEDNAERVVEFGKLTVDESGQKTISSGGARFRFTLPANGKKSLVLALRKSS